MGALGGLAHKVFELGEHLLDRVQIRRVGRQEEELGADRSQGGAYGSTLVAAEVVHDDDVSVLECRDEALLDVGKEAAAIDRSVEDARCRDPVVSKCRQEGHGGPATVRHFCVERLAASVPAASAGHVGLGPSLVDEDQAPGIDARLVLLPPGATPGDIRPILLAGEHGFF